MNLEKEIICGYEVSAKMKRVWAMELDIMKAFVEVCAQYGLTYRLICGTLLGAVRHKGYIPWDNDIDIAMPRKDFNKLLEIGPKAFQSPLFFQTPVTEDSRFFSTYVKIRNANSTAASRNEFDQGINCGIYIDIFCLDELPNNKLMRRVFTRQINEIAKMQRFCLEKPLSKGFVNMIKHELQYFVFRFVYHSPNAADLFRIYHKKAGKFAGKRTKEITHLDFGYRDNLVWERNDWVESVSLDFEDMSLLAPKRYDAVLRKQFGDYWKIPDDKSTHDYFEFDPDVPYKMFFNK